MFLGLVIATAILAPEVKPLEIIRGSMYGAPGMVVRPYWDVQDTYLDASDPDAPHGGDTTLAGGPSTVVLLRFGDLQRFAGSFRKVNAASITFHIVSGDKPQLTSIAKVLLPWGQGPAQTMVGSTPKVTLDPTAPVQKIRLLAATWKSRVSGVDGGAWQTPGAMGNSDTEPFEGASVRSTATDFTVYGLAPLLQQQLDHPFQNFGIALRFATPVEFSSSKAAENRPKLSVSFGESNPVSKADLSVVNIERAPDRTFTAHVKNLGTENATGFQAEWVVDDHAQESVDFPEALGPGGDKKISIRPAIRADEFDHRIHSVELRIHPKGPDNNPANDDLRVFADAIQVDVNTGELASNPKIEDWIQHQASIFNEEYLGESRYSFAPDGALERIAIRKITSGATPKGDPSIPIVVLQAGDLTTGDPSASFLKKLSIAIGAADLSQMAAPPGCCVIPGLGYRGGQDIAPGVVGGGDTRFDGLVPGQIPLPYEPRLSAIFSLSAPVSTGLLPMTSVYELNDNLGKARPSTFPDARPATVLLEVSDSLGRLLPNTLLEFFKSVGGKILDPSPLFTLSTNDSGIVVLPNRGTQGPFGKVDRDGGNGLLAVVVSQNGVSDVQFLKAWQLVDLFARGNRIASVFDLHFNVPGVALDPSSNLADHRLVSDSTGQGADVLTASVDGDNTTSVMLGSNPGDWLEIDLGRDRTLAEMSLSARPEGFWKSFEIVVYGTGQKVTEGFVFARETDWEYACRNRNQGDEKMPMVSYRGVPVRVRFVRIISKSGGVANLADLKVTPAKI